MRFPTVIALVSIACIGGCAATREQAGYGSRHNVRLQQPPEKAAACFARNAEEHSSALVSEVRRGRESAEVVVRVKNGVVYATADLQRAGAGSTASIVLMVTTSGRRSDLLNALTQGC